VLRCLPSAIACAHFDAASYQASVRKVPCNESLGRDLYVSRHEHVSFRVCNQLPLAEGAHTKPLRILDASKMRAKLAILCHRVEVKEFDVDHSGSRMGRVHP
jgi:hypothetical protein